MRIIVKKNNGQEKGIICQALIIYDNTKLWLTDLFSIVDSSVFFMLKCIIIIRKMLSTVTATPTLSPKAHLPLIHTHS